MPEGPEIYRAADWLPQAVLIVEIKKTPVPASGQGLYFYCLTDC